MYYKIASKCDVDVTEDSFKVLSSSPNNLDLRILESLYVFKTRLKLNGNTSALPIFFADNQYFFISASMLYHY